jgi:hypothetical protein
MLLLALAAVATAWSSYQANRWNGEQAKTTSRVNAARTAGTRAADLANTQTQIDIATFIQWVDAYAHRETELTSFYRKRFRKEFQPAFDAWVAQKPLTNPDAALTPFVLPEYRLAARVEEEALNAREDKLAAEVRRDIQRSSNYVLCVVLFAVALFFAGVSSRLGSPFARKAMLAMGATVFLGTVAWLSTFPVSLSV